MFISVILIKLDLFSVTEFFKINRESSQKTRTGGFFTLVLIGLIIYLISSRMKSRQRGQLMMYNSKTEFQRDLISLNTSQFMMAVKIQDLNFNYMLNHFHIQMVVRSPTTLNEEGDKVFNTRIYRLERCTQDHWKFNSKMLLQYNKYFKNDEALCLPRDILIQLQAQNFDDQSFAMVSIKRCTQKSLEAINMTCQDDKELQQALKKFSYPVSVIMSDIFINSNQLNYTTYYLKELLSVDFSAYTQSRVDIPFSKYEVTTDRSIMPLGQIDRQQGAFAKEKESRKTISGIISRYGTFVSIVLRRGTDALVIQRTDETLTDFLSYVGGLLASLISVFQIICSKYSSYIYEKQMYWNLRKKKPEEDDQEEGENQNEDIDKRQKRKAEQKKQKYKVATFWTFLKEKLGGFMNKKYQQQQAYVYQQIDVNLIIQKISLFEKMMISFIKKQQIDLKEIQKYDINQENQFLNYLLYFYKRDLPEESQNLSANDNIIDKPYSSQEFMIREEHQPPLEIKLNQFPPNQQDQLQQQGNQNENRGMIQKKTDRKNLYARREREGERKEKRRRRVRKEQSNKDINRPQILEQA